MFLFQKSTQLWDLLDKLREKGDTQFLQQGRSLPLFLAGDERSEEEEGNDEDEGKEQEQPPGMAITEIIVTTAELGLDYFRLLGTDVEFDKGFLKGIWRGTGGDGTWTLWASWSRVLQP